MKCEVCGRDITDEMDAWECERCGKICCDDCIDKEGYCDECAEEREAMWQKYHGFI